MSQATLPGVVPAAQTVVIKLEVKCVPKGQPRTRTQAGISRSGKAFARHYTPDTADGFKRAVQLAAGPYTNRRHDGPVRLSIVAFFPRTEKVWRKNPKTKVPELIEINHLPPDAPDEAIPMWQKPDRDNVDKAVLDAFGDMGLFAIGDEQVWGGPVEKWWAAKGSPSGVRIVIELQPVPEWDRKKTRRK